MSHPHKTPIPFPGSAQRAAHCENDDGEESRATLREMHEKYFHLRRVAQGQSLLHLTSPNAEEKFSEVYGSFLDTYSRGQLQYLEKLFLSADQDEDGKLNPFEFTYWMERQGSPVNQSELRSLFCAADKDGDGQLSFSEFLHFIKSINLPSVPSKTSELSRIFQGDEDNFTCPSHSNERKNSKYNEASHKISLNCKGSSKFYDNMANSVKSALKAESRHGFKDTVDFFEKEIAREYEEAKRNKQVNADLFKFAKQRMHIENSSLQRDSLSPPPPPPQAKKESLVKEEAEAKKFRTSLKINLENEPSEKKDLENLNIPHPPPLPLPPPEHFEKVKGKKMSLEGKKMSLEKREEISENNEITENSVVEEVEPQPHFVEVDEIGKEPPIPPPLPKKEYKKEELVGVLVKKNSRSTVGTQITHNMESLGTQTIDPYYINTFRNSNELSAQTQTAESFRNSDGGSSGAEIKSDFKKIEDEDDIELYTPTVSEGRFKTFNSSSL